MTALLGLYSTNSTIPVTSIAAFAANTNTETAYKQLCKDLYRVGVTEDMIQQTKKGILKILRSQGMVASQGTGGCEPDDEDQALEVAYKEFCKDLYRIGVTEGMIQKIKGDILEILRSRGIASSSNNSGGKGQRLEAGFLLFTCQANNLYLNR